MKRVGLATGTWSLEACGDLSHVPPDVRGRAFEIRVPPCVHSDLIRAGVIRHPDIGFNEEACQWIGRTDWRYRCVFTVDAATLAHEHVDLVLDGLDTIAVIEVNGEHVGKAMNMHHAHRFAVKPLLREGANELVITLRGPVTYVEEQQRLLGARLVNGDWTPYSYIRKMASNFQWDWGPRVATCGIWRGGWLEPWSISRIAGARPVILQATERLAIVRVDVDVEGDDERVQILSRFEKGSGAIEAQLQRTHRGAWSGELHIDHPQLWWPRGLGLQWLTHWRVVIAQDGKAIDWHDRCIGLRTVELLQKPDANGGTGFAIAVNGIPIFCKGANWIPEGLFPEDQSWERINERVRQAADANMNMLRVWGGGTYEQPGFYDACDGLGIMVWQDFMFACATYPEDEPYPALVEREAREAVTRLAHHPCIVLWCGGNENVLGYESWGWKQRMPHAQKWGERYYFDILPRIVSDLDPSRPYWPDSPHSGSARTTLRPNDPDRGDRHTWDAKIEEYRTIVPRFCSEFGHQSPPCWSTMREAWGEDQLHLDSRAMRHRQRAAGGGGSGNDVWYGSKVIGGRFTDPRNFDEWLYQAHVLQARAISIGIEWMRANQPHCMGALFWQFNDAWAGHSWSCIDSAGRRKPLWHAARKSFAPQLLTIQPIDGALRLCAINDSAKEWAAALRVLRMRVESTRLARHAMAIQVPPLGAWRSAPLHELVGPCDDERSECIVADVDDPAINRAWWFCAHDRELRLPASHVTADSTRIKDATVELTLHAHAMIRDAIIAVDRVDPAAVISDNVISLLPGETRILRIKTTADVPAETWITPPVFRAANDFSDRA